MKAIFITSDGDFVVERKVGSVAAGMKMRFNMQVWIVTDVLIDIPIDYWDDAVYVVTVRKFTAFQDF